MSSQLCQEDQAAVKGRDRKYKEEPHGKKDYYPPADSPGRLEMLTPLALGVGVVDIWPRQDIESNPRSILTPDSTSPPLTWEGGCTQLRGSFRSKKKNDFLKRDTFKLHYFDVGRFAHLHSKAVW